MDVLFFVSVLATTFGSLMSVAHFPQAYKIWLRKSSKDVSLLAYTIFSLGTIVWLVYGILLSDLPIIISYSIGVFGCFSVVFLALKYR